MNQVAVIHRAFEAPEDHNTVAIVNTELEGMEALEYAYRWTNNIDGSWSRKEKTFKHEGKTYPNGTASISDFKANVGETLEVNCWEGYHVTRRDFLSPFSLCDDPKFYSVTCDARYVSPYS